MKIHEKNFFQMKNQYMTQKKKSFEKTHKLYKNSNTYLDVQNEFAPKLLKKKKNLPKPLMNFMKTHEKKFFQMKNQYDLKKEESFENTHKLYKNSKPYLDVQNEFAPKSQPKLDLCSG